MLRIPPAGFSKFHGDVIDLRNDLVHDMRRLKAGVEHRLTFFLAKLKALYALSDAIALDARPDEVREHSYFLAAAHNMPENFFTGDTSDSSDDDVMEVSDDGASD
jgi:hypothetical protein